MTTITLTVSTPASVTPEQLGTYMREQMERTSEASDLPGDVWDMLDQAEITVSALPPAPLPLAEAVQYLSTGWGEGSEASHFKAAVDTLIAAALGETK